MNDQTPTDEEHEVRMADITNRIARGEYRVDPRAVAEAIVRQLGEDPAGRKYGRRARANQNECSNPASPL
jgi:hypothetical protein